MKSSNYTSKNGTMTQNPEPIEDQVDINEDIIEDKDKWPELSEIEEFFLAKELTEEEQIANYKIRAASKSLRTIIGDRVLSSSTKIAAIDEFFVELAKATTEIKEFYYNKWVKERSNG